MKKILSLLISCFLLTTLNAQLPIVKAVGGKGKQIDWASIKAKEEAKDGPGFFYNNCAQGVRPMKASSTLSSQGSKNYSIKNLNDDNPMTAWVEGESGYGIGAWFEVEAMTVNTIYNGYQSSPRNWARNSRVKRFKVYVEGKAVCYLDLTDEMGAQHFELPHKIEWGKQQKFRFEIADVYKGSKWSDVCISHIDHVACCVHKTTQLVRNDLKQQSIEQIKDKDHLLGIDLTTGKTYTTTAQKVIRQPHLSLLQLKTKNHRIALTATHPIYIKGQGFMSLLQYRTKMKLDSWQDCLDTAIKVKVWDAKTQTLSFETVEAIQKIEGQFETYTIFSAQPQTYIANGFVSKTY